MEEEFKWNLEVGLSWGDKVEILGRIRNLEFIR